MIQNVNVSPIKYQYYVIQIESNNYINLFHDQRDKVTSNLIYIIIYAVI